MTRIDFYLNAANKADVVRKLVVKALAADKYMFILTRDDAEKKYLDSFFWTSLPYSFLPHVCSEHVMANKTPVLLGRDPGKLYRPDILINFAGEIPEWLARFNRLLEVVTDDLHDKESARTRYRNYKSMGYQVEVHDLLVQK
jgi:DNA polymerase-3 subunit chi